jgi:flagellar basal body-associated protein FliL
VITLILIVALVLLAVVFLLGTWWLLADTGRGQRKSGRRTRRPTASPEPGRHEAAPSEPPAAITQVITRDELWPADGPAAWDSGLMAAVPALRNNA